MKKVKIVGLWILSIFFMLPAIVYFPSFSSLISVLIVALVIPISKWQPILNKYIKGKLKLIIVIILALVTIFTAPNTEVNAPGDTTSTIITEASTDSTVESTPETTIASTTEPGTESTTEPGTESTTEPGTESTTEPVAESTTESAAESTTESAAESTTESAAESTTESAAEPPHTHIFSAANCTTPKTCACGATEGEAYGHNWKDATCSDPKTCTICGTTSGLTAGHNFSNGTCTICGKADPDYIRETMVWIPTNGGTKYHTHAGCSNMENPEQATQSQAESLGFTPCKRCY